MVYDMLYHYELALLFDLPPYNLDLSRIESGTEIIPPGCQSCQQKKLIYHHKVAPLQLHPSLLWNLINLIEPLL